MNESLFDMNEATVVAGGGPHDFVALALLCGVFLRHLARHARATIAPQHANIRNET